MPTDSMVVASTPTNLQNPTTPTTGTDYSAIIKALSNVDLSPSSSGGGSSGMSSADMQAMEEYIQNIQEWGNWMGVSAPMQSAYNQLPYIGETRPYVQMGLEQALANMATQPQSQTTAQQMLSGLGMAAQGVPTAAITMPGVTMPASTSGTATTGNKMNDLTNAINALLGKAPISSTSTAPTTTGKATAGAWPTATSSVFTPERITEATRSPLETAMSGLSNDPKTLQDMLIQIDNPTTSTSQVSIIGQDGSVIANYSAGDPSLDAIKTEIEHRLMGYTIPGGDTYQTWDSKKKYTIKGLELALQAMPNDPILQAAYDTIKNGTDPQREQRIIQEWVASVPSYDISANDYRLILQRDILPTLREGAFGMRGKTSNANTTASTAMPTYIPYGGLRPPSQMPSTSNLDAINAQINAIRAGTGSMGGLNSAINRVTGRGSTTPINPMIQPTTVPNNWGTTPINPMIAPIQTTTPINPMITPTSFKPQAQRASNVLKVGAFGTQPLTMEAMNIAADIKTGANRPAPKPFYVQSAENALAQGGGNQDWLNAAIKQADLRQLQLSGAPLPTNLIPTTSTTTNTPTTQNTALNTAISSGDIDAINTIINQAVGGGTTTTPIVKDTATTYREQPIGKNVGNLPPAETVINNNEPTVMPRNGSEIGTNPLPGELDSAIADAYTTGSADELQRIIDRATGSTSEAWRDQPPPVIDTGGANADETPIVDNSGIASPAADPSRQYALDILNQQMGGGTDLERQLAASVSDKLANPETITPEEYATMRTTGKELLESQANEARRQLGETAGARGLESSGISAASALGIEQGRMKSLADLERDIMTTRATQRATDIQNAQQMAQSVASTQYQQQMQAIAQQAGLTQQDFQNVADVTKMFMTQEQIDEAIRSGRMTEYMDWIKMLGAVTENNIAQYTQLFSMYGDVFNASTYGNESLWSAQSNPQTEGEGTDWASELLPVVGSIIGTAIAPGVGTVSGGAAGSAAAGAT